MGLVSRTTEPACSPRSKTKCGPSGKIIAHPDTDFLHLIIKVFKVFSTTTMWPWYLEAFVSQKLGEVFRDWWTHASAVVQTRALCWIWMSVGVTEAVTFTCSASSFSTQRWVTCPSRGIVPSVCLGNNSPGMRPYRLTNPDLCLLFVKISLYPLCTVKYKYCNYGSCSQNHTFTGCTQCSHSYPRTFRCLGPCYCECSSR